jgi:hypothetical protein
VEGLEQRWVPSRIPKVYIQECAHFDPGEQITYIPLPRDQQKLVRQIPDQGLPGTMRVQIEQPDGRPQGVNLPVTVFADQQAPGTLYVTLTYDQINSGGVTLGFKPGPETIKLKLDGVKRAVRFELYVTRSPMECHPPSPPTGGGGGGGGGGLGTFGSVGGGFGDFSFGSVGGGFGHFR